MKILRVFNNNLVLARDAAGAEVILTGRGLGFQARPGQVVDPARVVRTFVPSQGRDPDHLAQLLAGVPPETIQAVGQALVESGLGQQAERTPTLVIALADHVNFAARRAAQGIEMSYPLRGEVMHLYPAEFDQARRLLAELNGHLDAALPESEEVAFALHLVNAAMANGDLSFTYQMTGVIQQMVAVIEATFGLTLPQEAVSVGRFITHLRYLFVRVTQHRQLASQPSAIGDAIRANYPEARECAQRLADIIELRLGVELTPDEVAYLTLHVARCAEER